MQFPDIRITANRMSGRRGIGMFLSILLFSLLTACGGGGSGGSSDDPSQEVVVSAPQDFSLSVQAIKTFRFDWTDVSGATHYRLLENPDGLSGFSQVGEDVQQGTETVALEVPLYARINARYILQACSANRCTDSEPLAVSDTLTAGIGYIKASTMDVEDTFGSGISISADGHTLVVGAREEDSGAIGVNGDEADNSVENAGAVYIFVRKDDGWAQAAYLKASNAETNDGFGESVSLSADGATLAVGASEEDSGATGVNGSEADNSAGGAGAVYLFVRTDTGWAQEAYLKASNAESNDGFGESVSLSADGATLAVGASEEDSGATSVNGSETDNSAGGAGAVYVFARTDTGWAQAAYLKASNAGSNDEFGESVSLSADGATLAVGASEEDSGATGINGSDFDNSAGGAGAVYLFERTDTGWAHEEYLKASNAESNDGFGQTVSLSADGVTLAVGAVAENSSATGVNGDETDNAASDAGAVYIFARSAGGWSQVAYLKASNTEAGDRFGGGLSLSADGTTLAVGADEEDSDAKGLNGDESNNSAIGSGAVYMFSRSSGGWSQIAYLKASNSEAEDDFGEAVSLSGNGLILASRSEGEDSSATGINSDQTDNSAAGSGTVYLY